MFEKVSPSPHQRCVMGDTTPTICHAGERHVGATNAVAKARCVAFGVGHPTPMICCGDVLFGVGHPTPMICYEDVLRGGGGGDTIRGQQPPSESYFARFVVRHPTLCSFRWPRHTRARDVFSFGGDTIRAQQHTFDGYFPRFLGSVSAIPHACS